MIIKNITKSTIVCNQFQTLKTISSQAKGLMFSKPKNLIFEFKEEKLVPIHMFFVFFSIDIIYLNKEKQVVELKQSVKPFTFYNPKFKCKYLIELKKGQIKESHVEVGDKLEFEYN